MRSLFYLVLFCLAAALSPHLSAADTIAPPSSSSVSQNDRVFVVGLSPFLDKSAKNTVYRGLVRSIVEELPLGSRLEVFDAYNLRSIARLAIPKSAAFNSPKTRANQFASEIGEIRIFLSQDNARPDGSKTNFDSAIRLPQFCDFLAQNPPSKDSAVVTPVLLLGSPLYQDAHEPDFSMADGYFPSDGHLQAARADSIFGLNAGENPGPPLQIYWSYFGDPWLSDLHRQKVERFWALYLERRAARLASFSSDLDTVLRAFASQAPGASAASRGWVADAQQTKPEMIRVNRTVQVVDWLTGDAGPALPPPPSQFVGPLKIGIRWKDNIDLDLYATPRPGAETLFFQHPRSPEGYYDMDHRSSPGRDYEFVEFETPVDIRKAEAFVNFYAGSCADGPRGEIRIEFLDRIYRGSFSIEASEGNRGRSGPSQNEFWTPIPIHEILGLHETTRASSAR
jgi:hypothetical protein